MYNVVYNTVNYSKININIRFYFRRFIMMKGGFGGMNMQALMKQAQAMQAKME